jgi:glutathione S-transferase
MRTLFFTTGSPFARAVRIVLVEKGFDFERVETFTTPSVEERAKITPTLQAPTLVDGNLTLWDSAVIGVAVRKLRQRFDDDRMNWYGQRAKARIRMRTRDLHVSLKR